MSELEAVVAICTENGTEPWPYRNPDMAYWAMKFLRTHAADIKAALKDAERMDFADRCIHALDWDGDGMKMAVVADDGEEYKGDTWREALDAAIDAALSHTKDTEPSDG